MFVTRNALPCRYFVVMGHYLKYYPDAAKKDTKGIIDLVLVYY